jgi:spore coat protein U-like protein
MKPRVRSAFLVLLGLMSWAELHAQSQTVQTTFRVSARVEAVCQVTAVDLDFGVYTGVQGGPVRVGSTQMQATCTPGTTYNVGLNEGTTAGATINQRKMASGANTLNYQLYSDSARSVIWGNTVGTDTVTGVGNGLAIDHTVYGSLPGGQAVPAGDYADTITIRIYY